MLKTHIEFAENTEKHNDAGNFKFIRKTIDELDQNTKHLEETLDGIWGESLDSSVMDYLRERSLEEKYQF